MFALNSGVSSGRGTVGADSPTRADRNMLALSIATSEGLLTLTVPLRAPDEAFIVPDARDVVAEDDDEMLSLSVPTADGALVLAVSPRPGRSLAPSPEMRPEAALASDAPEPEPTPEVAPTPTPEAEPTPDNATLTPVARGLVVGKEQAHEMIATGSASVPMLVLSIATSEGLVLTLPLALHDPESASRVAATEEPLTEEPLTRSHLPRSKLPPPSHRNVARHPGQARVARQPRAGRQLWERRGLRKQDQRRGPRSLPSRARHQGGLPSSASSLSLTRIRRLG